MKTSLNNNWTVHKARILSPTIARNDYYFLAMEFSILTDLETNPRNRFGIVWRDQNFESITKLLIQKLPKGGEANYYNDETLFTATLVSTQEIANILALLVEVWGANSDVRVPKEMLDHMRDFLRSAELKPKFMKLIKDGKYQEAFEQASAINNNALCFELGEFIYITYLFPHIDLNFVDLAIKFYQAVPEHSAEYHKTALTFITELKMQTALSIKEKFWEQFEKVQSSGKLDDINSARRMLIELANMQLTNDAAKPTLSTSTAIISEIIPSYNTILEKNKALETQIAELQKQVKDLQDIVSQRQ